MLHETSYTQARQNLAALLDQVTETREPVLIQRRGREAVALIAADELAGWLQKTCGRGSVCCDHDHHPPAGGDGQAIPSGLGTLDQDGSSPGTADAQSRGSRAPRPVARPRQAGGIARTTERQMVSTHRSRTPLGLSSGGEPRVLPCGALPLLNRLRSRPGACSVVR